MITRRSLMASAALAALPAHAQIFSPTLLGGANASYVAQAVHFDGATYFSCPSITSSDNTAIGVAFWFHAITFDSGALVTSDPSGGDNTIVYFPATKINFAPGSAGGDAFFLGSTTGGVTGESWHSFVAAADTSVPALKIYVDRVDVTSSLTQFGTFPFTVALNGLQAMIGQDGFSTFTTGDIADLRVAPGQNWLTAGDITAATLNLFTTNGNKPVSPSVATATLGAPAMLFSASTGDAASFATNQGTGGTFALTGTLTTASGP